MNAYRIVIAGLFTLLGMRYIILKVLSWIFD
jgi:hypothetical protein